MKHLKILPEYFEPVIYREKNFEIRYNDRDFKPYEIYTLNEYIDGTYTGRKCIIQILNIFKLDNIGFKNYVAFTFKLLSVEL